MKSNALSLLMICCALLGRFSPFTYGESDLSCPDWEEVFSRVGSDGGQLTISINPCQVFGYEIYTFSQQDGGGESADLIPNDLIIVWDEDYEHGSDEQYKNFTFSGNYVSDPNNSSVFLTTTDQRTNWHIYRVTESGVFTKGSSGTNEHELVHFYDMLLQKVDDVNDLHCRSPGDEITYTICYQNISNQTLENVVLIDWLPPGVTYPPGQQKGYSDPNYNPQDHFYMWQLGTIDPNVSGCVQLTVVVNEQSNPVGVLHNVAELWDATNYPLSRDMQDTKVCCWGGDVVYVDRNAPEPHTGASWQTAYTDLQNALDRAATGCGNTIYMADGLYKPGLDTASSFNIPDGVSVYGGFAGSGGEPNERNWNAHQTVLNGYIGQNDVVGSNLYNNIVVTMGNHSLLDGVIVEEGNRGIDASNAAAAIHHCVVRNNIQKGVYVLNGTLTITWSNIYGNAYQGIHHLSDANYLTVEHCRIHNNLYDGIRTVSSGLTVTNSLIYQNGAGSGGTDYYGMNIFNPFDSPLIRNNTIVQNTNAGLSFTGLYPPAIRNSIIYYNGGSQLVGVDPDKYAYFSCISDCNDLNGSFSDPPGFAYMAEPNLPLAGNYHLAYNALCVDAGDGDFYTAETDMDGEPRVHGTWIDIGADEAYTCDGDLSEDDIYHPLDWNADGLINYNEFSKFAAAWLSHDPNDPVCDPNHVDYVSDPNEPGYVTLQQKSTWNKIYNLADDIPDSMYTIDLLDFEVFCSQWAWTACWQRQQIETFGLQLYSDSGY